MLLPLPDVVCRPLLQPVFIPGERPPGGFCRPEQKPRVLIREAVPLGEAVQDEAAAGGEERLSELGNQRSRTGVSTGDRTCPLRVQAGKDQLRGQG